MVMTVVSMARDLLRDAELLAKANKDPLDGLWSACATLRTSEATVGVLQWLSTQPDFKQHFSDIEVPRSADAKQNEFNKFQVMLLKVLARHFDPMFSGVVKRFESSRWIPGVARTKM